jgi:hypothetical protein
MWLTEAVAGGYVSLDELRETFIPRRFVEFEWDYQGMHEEWFTEAVVEKINVNALRLGNKICLIQVEVELPPGSERPKSPLEKAIEGLRTAPASKDDDAASPYPPLKVNPFYTGFAGAPTAKHFILEEAERRFVAGEFVATATGRSELAKNLAEWWGTERAEVQPAGTALRRRSNPQRQGFQGSVQPLSAEGCDEAEEGRGRCIEYPLFYAELLQTIIFSRQFNSRFLCSGIVLACPATGAVARRVAGAEPYGIHYP